jgi:aspartyl aminopeptidase
MSNTASVDSTAELLRFLDASPTPYHAVAEAVRQLSARGFVELDEREQWRIEPGLRGYVVRGGGTVVAFVMGSDPPAQAGFVMLGAHTDSPNLRLKPLPDVDSVGYLQIGVEVYGGVLFSTWLDRDLSIAGRVTLRGGETRLVKLERPVCRIPNLAIHLDREVNTPSFVRCSPPSSNALDRARRPTTSWVTTFASTTSRARAWAAWMASWFFRLGSTTSRLATRRSRRFWPRRRPFGKLA